MGSAYYYFVYRPAHHVPVEVGYVLPSSVEVVDTPAEIRLVVGALRSGERVEITKRTRNWARIRAAGNLRGWIENKDLLDAQTYESGQKLLRQVDEIPAQAEGHTSGVVNLRLGPARDAMQLAQLSANFKVQVFGRQLVDRPNPEDQPSPTAVRDAWYLIRAESRAGWVLGHFILLDPPEPIAPYAQGSNLVAWLVLRTVNDEGKAVPEYLTAERLGTQEADFSHIRVLTWWAKHQEYVTAYVESDLTGYFPIKVTQSNGIPYFRLRLKDEQGQQYQKVYGLFDTITRSVGTVQGWDSDAVPPPPEDHHGRRSKRTDETRLGLR